MKSDVAHKKSVLNFNANEWSVERPAAQPIKPVVPDPITNSQQNTGNNFSVPQVNGQQDKEKNPVLIAIVVALVVVLFAFAIIIVARSNNSAHIDMGQAIPIAYAEEQISGVLENIFS